MRPDLEFDDPDDEEWAAYVLHYIQENQQDHPDGFTRMGIGKALNIEYTKALKYLGILQGRDLIKSSFYTQNIERIALPNFQLNLPDLTPWQVDVYKACLQMANGVGQFEMRIPSLTKVVEGLGRKNPNPSSLRMVLCALETKKYLTIHQYGRFDIPFIIETLVEEKDMRALD